MRAPVISRTVKSFIGDCTVVNKETGETSRRDIVTTIDSDKARNKSIESQGLQLCFTHSVKTEEATYEMPLDVFLSQATKLKLNN